MIHYVTPVDSYEGVFRCACGEVFESDSGFAVCPKIAALTNDPRRMLTCENCGELIEKCGGLGSILRCGFMGYRHVDKESHYCNYPNTGSVALL